MRPAKSLFTLILFIGSFITASAQDVKQFTINNNTYYGTKAIPDEFIGVYKYEKDKEPIVDVQKDQMGKFQVHGVPAYPAEFWIETDAQGNIQKRTGVNNNYQVVLILQYGDNGQSGWKGDKKGTYDRIEATVAYDQGFVIILGERFKILNQ